MNQGIDSRVDGETRFAAIKVILSTNHQKNDGDLDNGVNINNTIVLTGGGDGVGRNGTRINNNLFIGQNITSINENLFDFTDNNGAHNKFMVEADSGNIYTKGTLNVSGNTTIGGTLQINTIPVVENPSNVFVETGDGYIRKIASDDLTIGTAKKIKDANNEYTPTSIKNEFNTKADKVNITGATKTKITYNSQGIITAGADLAASDIPSHTHTIANITGLQTALDGKAKIYYNAIGPTNQGLISISSAKKTCEVGEVIISAIVYYSSTTTSIVLGNTSQKYIFISSSGSQISSTYTLAMPPSQTEGSSTANYCIAIRIA